MDYQKIILVGDVHGKINKLIRYIDDIHFYNEKFQYILLGDVGFKEEYDYLISLNISNLKVLFGNHDYYPYLNNNIISLGNYYSFEYNGNKILCLRGGISMDKKRRFLNIDYFEEEDYDYKLANEILDYCEVYKPDIIISHVLPTSIGYKLFGYYDNFNINNTFDEILELYKPKKWICGHYHKSINIVIDDVEYKILNELEMMIL